ncbi:hypothetical protein SLEP1_g40232 [Rubroshorea leprosula]|uniref:G-patch domain-containing protein n=1 Tax=Rubroshorea leprosula TaxID=152421 RepID=A0AAV5L2T2_9ROSI|nr:hypothetical protein SLEP1_g40232 [Rubroshorea leprosula]
MDSHTSKTQPSAHRVLLEFSARTQRLNEETISYLHQLTKDNEHLCRAHEQLEEQLQDMTINRDLYKIAMEDMCYQLLVEKQKNQTLVEEDTGLHEVVVDLIALVTQFEGKMAETHHHIAQRTHPIERGFFQLVFDFIIDMSNVKGLLIIVPRRKFFKKWHSPYLLRSRVIKMFEENAAINPEKSAVDKRVDKLEATMQTMAATLQTISLTLSTLTTSSVLSLTSLIPTIPVPPIFTITLGNRIKDPMVTQLQFPPIYENQPLVGESSSHAPQISSLPFEALYPPFKMNNPTLPTITSLTLNVPPLMGQVPTIQPNPSIAMLRSTLEDGKSREMYARKMTPYANDERVLIHYFQDNLSGPASVWFSTLDKKKICTFKDVSQAFMKQYEYYMSLALTRDSLQRITKKGHGTENCAALRHRIQDLIDESKLQLNVKEAKGVPNITQYPLPPHDAGTMNMITFNGVEKPVLENTSSCESFMGKTSSVVMPQCSTILNSIANDVSNMTHSGRCYVSPEGEESRRVALKSKDIRIEKMPEESPKKLVSENEVAEFLNILRKSEYSIIEQLNKTLAKISILELMLSSEVHLDALLKVLQEAHVPKNIDTQKFGTVVGAILAPNYINFIDDEIPDEGNGHTKVLHISVQCKRMNVPHVLIDNGSTLNVAAKIMFACHYHLGEGLGFDRQGILEPIEVIQAWGTFGLGYKLKKEDWQRMRAIKAEKCLSRLQGRDPRDEPMAFMEKHPNFHLVHHAKTPMETHESVLLETVKEESLCDSWGNLTINALDEEKLEFDRGISRVNGSSQANWIAELLPAAFISEEEESASSSSACDYMKGGIQQALLYFMKFMPANDESLNNDAISDFIYEIDDQTYSEEDNENFDHSHELTQMLREEKPKLQPNQETETINLGTEDDREEIKINAHLSTEERKELIKLLYEFQDVFGWSYKDMPGLDLDIAVHAIPLYSKAKPIK